MVYYSISLLPPTRKKLWILPLLLILLLPFPVPLPLPPFATFEPMTPIPHRRWKEISTFVDLFSPRMMSSMSGRYTLWTMRFEFAQSMMEFIPRMMRLLFTPMQVLLQATGG